jgi:hypothetical protein
MRHGRGGAAADHEDGTWLDRKELRRQPRHQRDYRPSLPRSFRNGSDQLANDSATNRSCYSVA